ncbi:hypothetical protein ACFMPD_07975 [Sedimentitalea sp. HM32M-2]|uniref:hypothetical protein n=1 Tax=Sedimentitalea sp. HM32M-2 TaxID=3351566 RepID=UPI00363269F0
MRHVVIAVLVGLVLALAGNAPVAFAQSGAAACAPPGYPTDVRPGGSGPPTQVSLGMRVVDLLDIDDVNQTITVDVAVRMSWTDPRLADWAGCKLSISDIWFPNMMLKNSGRIFDRFPHVASVTKGGEVVYLQRSSGTFSSYHSLENFPFETQVITLHFYPLDWSLEKLEYRIDETFTGLATPLNISDWRILGVDASLSQVEIPALQQVRAGFDLNISAERYLGYYIWKILLPITLIVFMSWSVFWIDPSQFSTQIGLSTTSVLTMIAFIFATTNLLPKLAYFTILDRFIAGATLFVFAGLLHSLTTGFLVRQGRGGLANRMDRISRLAFPAAFLVFGLTIYLDAASA